MSKDVSWQGDWMTKERSFTVVILYPCTKMYRLEYRKEDLPSEIAATPWVNFGGFTYKWLKMVLPGY